MLYDEMLCREIYVLGVDFVIGIEVCMGVGEVKRRIS